MVLQLQNNLFMHNKSYTKLFLIIHLAYRNALSSLIFNCVITNLNFIEKPRSCSYQYYICNELFTYILHLYFLE